ncbi:MULTISPECIES: hypothetical protein [unclassified Saccharothrix]|uniref:hypothetical protein n=1 Tax=unclassified Saccharothrix TaxID=2593673 RepID=UPI00307D7294
MEGLVRSPDIGSRDGVVVVVVYPSAERNEAGRRGELLAESGDLEGALRVWAEAYGEIEPTTKRLAELYAENGDLNHAVSTWMLSDALRGNPLGRHQQYRNSLSWEERLWDDDDDGTGDEGWEFQQAEVLARLLFERGDEAAMAELRAMAAHGDYHARAVLGELG